MLHRVAHRRCGIQGGKHSRARRLDIRLQTLDLLLPPGVRITRLGEGLSRRIPCLASVGGRLHAAGDSEPSRLAPRFQLRQLSRNLPGADRQRLRLVTIEFLLLFPTMNIEFPRVRLFPNLRRAAVHLRLLDSQTGQVGLRLRQPCGSGRLAFARLCQPGACQFDRACQLAVATSEQNLLPPSQFLSESPVAAGLCRLPFQRAPLLLHLKDNVVDPGEVLLSRLKLQLSRPGDALCTS